MFSRSNAQYKKKKNKIKNTITGIGNNCKNKCHFLDLNKSMIHMKILNFIENYIISIIKCKKFNRNLTISNSEFYKKEIEIFLKKKIKKSKKKINQLKYILKNIEKIFKNINLFADYKILKKMEENLVVHELFRNHPDNIAYMDSNFHTKYDLLNVSFDVYNLDNSTHNLNDSTYNLKIIFSDKKNFEKELSDRELIIKKKSLEYFEPSFYAMLCKTKSKIIKGEKNLNIINHDNKIYKIDENLIFEYLVEGKIFKSFLKFEEDALCYTGNKIECEKQLYFEFLNKIFKLNEKNIKYNFGKLLKENNSFNEFLKKNTNNVFLNFFKKCINEDDILNLEEINKILKKFIKDKYEELNYDLRRWRPRKCVDDYLKEILKNHNFINPFKNKDFYIFIGEKDVMKNGVPVLNQNGSVRKEKVWDEKTFKFKKLDETVLNEAKIDKGDKNPGSEIERLEPPVIASSDKDKYLNEIFENDYTDEEMLKKIKFMKSIYKKKQKVVEI